MGYYGFMCHAVREAFKRTMNDVRNLGVYDDVLGSKEQIEEVMEDVFNSVPKDAIFDFESVKKEDLVGK